MTAMIEIVFIVIAVLLVLSVIASKFSDRYGIPALLIFLGVGMLAGSEGLGGIYFDDPVITQVIGFFALVIILFSGGLDSDWNRIRRVAKEALVLATLGVLLTAAILGVFAHLVLGISLLEGLLIGAITSSTDAAAVFSLLRAQGVRLKGKLAPMLELESGSNDPMAVFLTLGLIMLIQSPDTTVANLFLLFAQQMVIGGLVGVLVGRLALYLINNLRLGYEGLYPVLMLGMLLLTFGAANLAGGSGFLAVYLLGLSLAREEFLHKRSLSRFYDGMAWLVQIIMFLTLGLFVFPSRLLPVAGTGVILAAVLVLVARPLGVWISLLPFRFSNHEKALVAWVGLRGAVPIILATYPFVAGLPGSDLIFNVIFFVVLVSVLLQGTTIGRVARWLKVDAPEKPELEDLLDAFPRTGWPGILMEVTLKPGSAAEGRAIYQLGLPRDYLIVLVARGDEFLIPNGSIILQSGDRLLGLSRAESHDAVKELLDGSS